MLAYTFGGKAVLVTGGASGIGRSACEEFGRSGASVVVTDIDLAGAEQTAAHITAAGGSAAALAVDVTREDQVDAMVQFAVDRFGRLDCALNNAGIAGVTIPFTDVPLEVWRATIETNLTSVFLCMRAELRHMAANGGGAIVNVASTAALRPPRWLPHYTASKSGVLGLTKSGAVEFARQNIRVNAVVPGSTDTPMLRGTMGQDPEVVTEISARQAMGRMAAPEEIAAAAVWLCSDAASFVNGLTMAVDGGFLCH